MNKFKGIITALLTPFDKNNKINENALAQLIEMNIRRGVCGFYVAGSTAEVYLLSNEERLGLYKTVKDIVGKRATLIAHVGSVSADFAKQYTVQAQNLGYDAISLLYRHSTTSLTLNKKNIILTLCRKQILIVNLSRVNLIIIKNFSSKCHFISLY